MRRLLCIVLLSFFAASAHAQQSAAPLADIKPPQILEIAHRGASGYLPEHSRAALVMAHALGANFIEFDVQLSRDGVPVILHDVMLDAVTNVAAVYPQRHRSDGHYYVVDFTVAELRALALQPRRNDQQQLLYPNRFARTDVDFAITTLAQQLALLQELNRVRERDVGAYIEVKSPRWYRDQRLDPTAALMTVLEQAGYSNQARPTPIFIESFDPEPLRRIRTEFDCDLPLIQLIGENAWNEAPVDFSAMRTSAGLQALTGVVDGVGVWWPQVILGVDEQQQPRYSQLVSMAHKAGLVVHVYTLREEGLPDFIGSYRQLREWLKNAGVDGLFTDYPGRR